MANSSASLADLATRIPPALPLPPTNTWDFMTTRPPNSSAICLASMAVEATRPFGIGMPYLEKICFD